MRAPRKLQRLTDHEIETLVPVLKRSAEAHRVLDLVDYDSLVRIRIAVTGQARREQLHGELRARESAA